MDTARAQNLQPRCRECAEDLEEVVRHIGEGNGQCGYHDLLLSDSGGSATTAPQKIPALRSTPRSNEGDAHSSDSQNAPIWTMIRASRRK